MSMNEAKMLIPLARDFALKAHKEKITTTAGGLKRPQILHLQEVADLVWVSGGTEVEIAAAWLHDSVEDTATTLDDIVRLFGKEVVEIVKGLTDLEGMAALPVAVRKRRQAERILGESESVRRIKIADQISNVRSLALDPTISMTPLECREYVEGARMIVDGCRGISALLDNLFLEVYEKGMGRYRS